MSVASIAMDCLEITKECDHQAILDSEISFGRSFVNRFGGTLIENEK